MEDEMIYTEMSQTPDAMLTSSRLRQAYDDNRNLTARIIELELALGNMLEEFDDPSITDDIKTQFGMSANTVKALQKARVVLKDKLP
jgi:predicted RNA-binding protein (virulence factor B family)